MPKKKHRSALADPSRLAPLDENSLSITTRLTGRKCKITDVKGPSEAWRRINDGTLQKLFRNEWA